MKPMLLVFCLALQGCVVASSLYGGPYKDPQYQSSEDQQRYRVSCVDGMFGSWELHHWMTPAEAVEVNRTGLYQNNSLHGKCTVN